MGGSSSRNQVSNERDGQPAPYRYPPENDKHYFANHYYLGHRKFETGDPELFLFGDLPDLNYLPSQPTTFPYKQPPKSQPVACLRSFVNIQRESIKLTRTTPDSNDYNIEFIFDADVDCAFTIVKCVPDTTPIPQSGKELSLDESMEKSDSFHYSAGSDQSFNERGYIIRPSDYPQELLSYDPDNEQNKFPLVILMQTASGDQCQMTVCSIEAVNNSSGYVIKFLKQKLLADGVEYLLQEVYGLENKAKDDQDDQSNASDIEEDLGVECVICITDTRDTILLPCRHLCLCSSCAANLRYQSSNCPICRAPFRALLQIQALESLDDDQHIDDDEMTGNPKYSTVPGYQCVPLLQALNGYNLEPRDDDLGPKPKQVSNDKEESSTPQDHTHQNQQRSSDELVCVVPIEDEVLETDHVSPTPAIPPSRRVGTTKPSRSSKTMDTCDNLPGTPHNDHITLSLDEDSHCGSSVSSDVSVKSSDMLLPTHALN